MKKLPNQYLIYIGLFFISAVLLLNQFYRMPDLIAGSLFGIGIGLMVFPFILNKKKKFRP